MRAGHALVIVALATSLVGCPCQPTGVDPCGGSPGVTGRARFVGFAPPYTLESCLDSDCASASIVSSVGGVVTLTNGVELVYERPDASTGVGVTLRMPWSNEPNRRFAWTLTLRGTSEISSSRDVDTGAERRCDRTCATDQVIDFGTLAPPP